MPSPDIRRNQVRVNVTTNVVRANARATGVQGAQGIKGDTGATGENGQGVPTGGTVGQVLAKNSSTNYDTSFKTLTKTDVGLSNVDNTTDLNKPLSTATQTALDGKITSITAGNNISVDSTIPTRPVISTVINPVNSNVPTSYVIESTLPFAPTNDVVATNRIIVIGMDGTNNRLFGRDGVTGFISQSDDNGVTWTHGKVRPTGIRFNNMTKMVVFNGYFYLSADDASGNWFIYRTPAVNAATAYTWDATPAFTYRTDANNIVRTPFTATSTAIFVGEYCSVASLPGGPIIYKSTDGVTFTQVYQDAGARHIHSIKEDPYNIGTIYACIGDNGTSNSVIRSIDNGNTWSTIINSNTNQWQSVQISFSPKWVWLAMDRIGGTVAIFNRTELIPRVAAVNSPYNTAVPALNALTDRFYQIGYFGTVDPLTESFYYAAQDTSNVGNRFGLFWLPNIGGELQLLDAIPTGASITEMFINNGVLFTGSRTKPLIKTVPLNPTTLTKNDIGLSLVDNTSDASKPISALQQASLDTKSPINSPSFTGVPTAPTAVALTNNNQIASTQYADQASAAAANAIPINNYILKAGDSSIGTLNPGNAQSLGSAANYWANVYATRHYLNSTAYIDGTVAGRSSFQGDVTLTGTLRSTSNLSQTLGLSSNYFLNLFSQRTTLNATSYIDGSTAGLAALTGSMSVSGQVILPSTATGIAAYNTTDQTTNYERVRQFWSGNTFYIAGEVLGTGANRTIRITPFGTTATGGIQVNSSSGNGFAHSFGTSATGGAIIHKIDGTLSATTSLQYSATIVPTINQSATAGYTALLINPTETSTGSGAKNLIDAQVGGVSKFLVDNQGNTTPTTAQFTPLATPAYKAGLLYFDTAEDALTFYSNDANVMMNIGQEQFMRVTNNTAAIINNGVPVYINGQLAGFPTVAPSGNTTSTLSRAIGLTTETLAVGATGYVAIQGKVRNVDTSTFAAGSVLYVGATAGSLTATGPSASSAFVTRIGTVLTSNATTGIILVDVAQTPQVNFQSATADLGLVLSNNGLRGAGTAYPITTSGAVTLSGAASLNGATAIGNGGYRSASSPRTASATLVAGSALNNLCDATTASFTLTLPAASASNGQTLWFKKTDATVNTITISRAGTDTIEGATSYTLSTQFKYVELINNGTNAWFVRANN